MSGDQTSKNADNTGQQNQLNFWNQAENLDFKRFVCAESDRHIYFGILTLKNWQNTIKLAKNAILGTFRHHLPPMGGSGDPIEICHLKP